MRGTGYCPNCKTQTFWTITKGRAICKGCEETSKMPKPNKYHAERTWSELCQRIFDSKAEMRRGEELALLEKAGEIEDLTYQVIYVLSKSPKVTIKLDFRYFEPYAMIHEDVKGVITRDFRTKLAWLAQSYGIEVKIVKS